MRWTRTPSAAELLLVTLRVLRGEVEDELTSTMPRIV